MYRCSLCILSKQVIRSIEQKFDNLLLKEYDTKARGVKVSWEIVCVPKKEGRLGIKNYWRLKDIHEACMEPFAYKLNRAKWIKVVQFWIL